MPGKARWGGGLMAYFDIWTVYKQPADYPDQWVARAWRIETGREPRQGRAVVAPTLEEVRELIPIDRFQLHRMERTLDDDPSVYESWI
jgi:hypothetical protein